MAVTDIIFKPLTRAHFITWIANIVSFIFCMMYASKVTMEQKFSLKDQYVVGGEVVEKDVESGLFHQMNSLWILAISEIIVFVTMTVHVFRRVFECLPSLYSGKDKEGRVVSPNMAAAASVLHIASYTCSHFSALLVLFLMAGYKDTLAMIGLFLVTLSAEALQHLMSNPNTNLKEGRSALILFSAGGLLVYSIFIGVGLGLQDQAGMKGAVAGFILLVICEALKFVNELLQGEPTINYLFGEVKLSFWKKTVDARVAQAVLDAMIKTGLMWYMNLSYYGQHGGLDDVDIESGKVIALAVTISIGGLFFLLSLAGLLIPALKEGQQDDASKEQYPSATMSEKERMLQVA